MNKRDLEIFRADEKQPPENRRVFGYAVTFREWWPVTFFKGQWHDDDGPTDFTITHWCLLPDLGNTLKAETPAPAADGDSADAGPAGGSFRLYTKVLGGTTKTYGHFATEGEARAFINGLRSIAGPARCLHFYIEDSEAGKLAGEIGFE